MLSLEKNGNKNKAILLTMGALLLPILMTSCGITDKTENQNIVYFLFGLIDKYQSGKFFLLSTIAAAIYWVLYFINKRKYKEERMYGECENDSGKGYDYFLFKKGINKLAGRSDTFNTIINLFSFFCYAFPFVCPALAVLLFYSWIIHSRGALYWIVCIATYIVLFPKSPKSRSVWVKVWSVISLAGFILMLTYSI